MNKRPRRPPVVKKLQPTTRGSARQTSPIKRVVKQQAVNKLTRTTNARTNRRRRGRVPISPLFLLIVIIAVATYFFIDTANNGDHLPHEGMYVHFIDVGQGDATLVVTSAGNVLIDGGDNNMGRRVNNYLDSLGINSLSYVIATHPHADHIGGLISVLDEREVGVLILPQVVHNTNTFERFLDAIDNNNVPTRYSEVGTSFNLGGAIFTILAPQVTGCGNLNNCSVVLRVDYGERSFLLTADAELESENHMLDNFYNHLNVDVLRIGHHGSHTSTSDPFLAAVDPSIAVISVGQGNNWGHPHAVVMDRLAAASIPIYRTDMHGNIVMWTNGIELNIEGD